MKNRRWELVFAVSLVLASLALYAIHFLIYRDAHHIGFWALSGLAFLPIDVLVVTLVVDRLLGARERALRMEKMNMLIGVFFSTAGTRLLRSSASCDPDLDVLRGAFGSAAGWKPAGLAGGRGIVRRHKCDIRIGADSLTVQRDVLIANRDFLVRLLENPNLLEHEAFTELLRAVFHLAEELALRGDLAALPETDIQHLSGDVSRVYRLLLREWVEYVASLQTSYPYLFSLAIRQNPLYPQDSVIVAG